MSRLLTPLEISEILHDLVTLLAAEGQAGSIFVIGGAVIALENPNRHTTRDIDGWLRTVDIEDAVQALSVKYGLDARWFDSPAGVREVLSGEALSDVAIARVDHALGLTNS